MTAAMTGLPQAVIVSNPSGDVTVTAPARPDGGTWSWEMVTDASRVYADQPDLLLDSLYPGYSTMTDREQWTARYLIAVLAQAQTQARVNAQHDILRLPAEQRVTLTGPRHRTIMVPSWDCVVPLILIRTDYAPATAVLAPQPTAGMAANVWWIDPSDDETLLTTLHEIGYVAVHRATASTSSGTPSTRT